MAHPVEEVVGGQYKHMVRFMVAAGAIIAIVMVSSDRAKSFVDERVEQRVRVLDANVEEQKRQIEKLDARLSAIHEGITDLKTDVTEIRAAVRQKGR